MMKASLRKEMLSRRLALTPEEIAHRSERITYQVLQTAAWDTSDVLLAYCAVRGEADPAMLVRKAWESGKAVYLPKTAGTGMNFLRFDPDMSLTAGRYKIPEPPADAAIWDGSGQTLVLVPGAAFSTDGYRIGYGGGYYDRFFSDIRSGGHAPAGITLLGLSYDFQISDQILPQSHDVRLHAVAAEDTVYICQIQIP